MPVATATAEALPLPSLSRDRGLATRTTRATRGRCLSIWALRCGLASLLLVAGLFCRAYGATAKLESLPLTPSPKLFCEHDWLLLDESPQAGIYRDERARDLILDNGLIRRTIRLSPYAATIALDDHRTGASLLRSVRPEALVTIDGQPLRIGGAAGQENHAYLTADAADRLRDEPLAVADAPGPESSSEDAAPSEADDDRSPFRLTGFTTADVQTPFAWKRTRHAEEHPWPPKGAAVVLHFQGVEAAVNGVSVDVRYEIYEGIPVICKSLTITNNSQRSIRIDSLTTELLAAVEGESIVDEKPEGTWQRPPIDVLSDYMFHGMDPRSANRVAQWEPDPLYQTQVNYGLKTPCLLACRPPAGPGVDVAPNASLESFRVFLVLQDSSDRERQGLTLRRTWRTLAPWTTENPLMMHVRDSQRKLFRAAVDQCAEVGFEMIIYTFGSNLNMEDTSPAYVTKIREDVEYAHARGVQVGGYSLFSSRQIDEQNDVVHPETGRPGGAIFGNAPCFGSEWGRQYETRLKEFLESTDLDLLEHDGPYPGDLCASTAHPGHRGLEDSQWTQWQTNKNLYSWCRARGIYVNQPDYYFLSGGSKTAMGYRETNWSLPRAQQLIHARQNIYDGTWTKTPSMGWMFVPLTEYHGGGAAATIEPLDEHRDDYQRHLVNCLSAGVQACLRGPRLYDTPTTKEMVVRWVDWFKQHRAILESDVIHGRRPDGRDIDFIVHVNHRLPERGLAVFHNPLDVALTRKIRLPLYYTGLSERASVRSADGASQTIPLNGQGQGIVDVTVPARGMTYLVIERDE